MPGGLRAPPRAPPAPADGSGSGSYTTFTGYGYGNHRAIRRFAYGGTLPVGPKPAGFNRAHTPPLLLTDMNGDGRADYLAARSQFDSSGDLPGALFVSLTQPDATPGPLATYTVPVEPIGLTAVDLDGDGDRDVLLSNANSTSTAGGLQVRINDGTGAFLLPVYYSGDSVVYSLLAADLDGDADVDVILGTSLGFNNRLNIYENQGHGAMLDEVTAGIPVSISPNGGPALADFNMDGFLDVTSSGSVILNDQSGGFGAAISSSVGGQFHYADARDFDGNGIPDVLYRVGGDTRMAFGNGDGTFAAGLPIGTEFLQDFRIADVNNDGHLDFFARVELAPFGDVRKVVLHLGDGAGNFGPQIVVVPSHEPQVLGGPEEPRDDPVLGDFDGDKDLDILIPLAGPGDLWLFEGVGDGTFFQSTSHSLGHLFLSGTGGSCRRARRARRRRHRRRRHSRCGHRIRLEPGIPAQPARRVATELTPVLHVGRAERAGLSQRGGGWRDYREAVPRWSAGLLRPGRVGDARRREARGGGAVCLGRCVRRARLDRTPRSRRVSQTSRGALSLRQRQPCSNVNGRKLHAHGHALVCSARGVSGTR